MFLLLLFAFFAGIVTILSPCILPVLPIILSSGIGGHDTGKSRPFGVVVGFIASFTFFTLFLSTIVRLIGIPGDSLRIISVVVIAGFGISLLIPQFQVLLEELFSKLTRFIPTRNTSPGFLSGFLVGMSLGLLWTPCVGPILASVISLAITGTVTTDAFLITLAYSFGTAIPMFAIMVGGQSVLRKMPLLVSNTGLIQKTFGVIMIITAIAIFTNADRRLQTFILTTFPQYGIGLTQFEDIQPIRDQLDSLRRDVQPADSMGKPMFDVTDTNRILAPELIPGGVWLNSKPLTLAELRGKVVLIDFWTYSCINCQRTLPYLTNWWEKYSDDGLVIIGVHSPEFEFEKNEKNVRQALEDFNIRYPVMQDNDFATWRAYSNRYWPAKYLIDATGSIRYTHFGEGEYDETEQMIQKLLKEAGSQESAESVSNPAYEVYSRTPELYLGYGRVEYLSSPEKIKYNSPTAFTSPKTIAPNTFAYEGTWRVMEEYANPQAGASLTLNFESKEVFLVMRTKGAPAQVKVFVDGKIQYIGVDVEKGIVTIDADRLYKLVDLPDPGQHILRLEFLDENVEVYAFTFG